MRCINAFLWVSFHKIKQVTSSEQVTEYTLRHLMVMPTVTSVDEASSSLHVQLHHFKLDPCLVQFTL